MSENRKGGRPRIMIDQGQVEELASIGCSWDEIAGVLRCSRSTLQRNFAQAIEKGRARLKKSLRHKQVEVALGGNVAMLIWLGKQYLGQSDKVKQDGELVHYYVSGVREKPLTEEEWEAKVAHLVDARPKDKPH